MIKLSNLQPAEGSVKNKTRLGRGQGSGGGGTAKRGHKGAKSRSGYSQKRGFEGGQMPLQRRVPKFGFKNINRVEYKAINLDTLQELIDKTNTSFIDLGLLFNNGLIAKSDLVKILGRGELSKAVEVKVNAFSKSAVEAIEKAGGKAIVDRSFNPENSADIKVIKTVSSFKANRVANIAAEVKVEKVGKATKVEASVTKEENITKAVPSKGDDLKKVEGIGPKIAGLLIDRGIDTFVKLSEAGIEVLEEVLREAGSRFAMHDPSTWAEQAKLAANGNWDELKELQDRLLGGRPE